MVINHLLTGMHPHDGDVPAMVHGCLGQAAARAEATALWA